MIHRVQPPDEQPGGRVDQEHREAEGGCDPEPVVPAQHFSAQVHRAVPGLGPGPPLADAIENQRRGAAGRTRGLRGQLAAPAEQGEQCADTDRQYHPKARATTELRYAGLLGSVGGWSQAVDMPFIVTDGGEELDGRQ